MQRPEDALRAGRASTLAYSVGAGLDDVARVGGVTPDRLTVDAPLGLGGGVDFSPDHVVGAIHLENRDPKTGKYTS